MELISKEPVIFLIAGKARSGKNTFGDFLKRRIREAR